MKYSYHYDKELLVKDEERIPLMYDKGFVLTRKGKGVMQQIRSLRISLDKFSLSSENRRVLRKNQSLELSIIDLPMASYDWKIHSMGSLFYSKKFGKNTMSANRIKDMVKDKKTSFNTILEFKMVDTILGYCICFLKEDLIHYAYPFYDTEYISKGLGIGMMTKTVEYAKEIGIKYVYLGSVFKKESLYKLQFSGEEWFFESKWDTNISQLKKILRDN